MDFEIIRPGPGRLIRALIDELQIIETINNQVRWDPKQWKISPGELIAALIITFFCQRHALYKVCDFYKHQDLDLLFGRKDLCANDFNDDCLARSLDRLEESEFHKLYGLILVKDKRFDLKQIKSGLCVNSDGFPIHGEPINGNKDDKTWSGELLTKFKKVVNDELTQILVADSALITIKNLKIMYEKGILFISRLPDNFGSSEELKLRAWRENNWQ